MIQFVGDWEDFERMTFFARMSTFMDFKDVILPLSQKDDILPVVKRMTSFARMSTFMDFKDVILPLSQKDDILPVQKRMTSFARMSITRGFQGCHPSSVAKG